MTNCFTIGSTSTFCITYLLPGPESKVPTGILEAELELFPRVTQCLEENVVRTQLELERGKQAEQDRRFLEYAKHWWREDLDIKPAHQDRLIKIFALVRCIVWYGY